MTPGVRIRPAEHDDVDGLSALESRYYIGNLDPAQRADGVISVLHPVHRWTRAVEHGEVYVAVTGDDVVVAFMVVSSPPDPTDAGLPAVLREMLALTETVQMNGRPIARQRYPVHGPV